MMVKYAILDKEDKVDGCQTFSSEELKQCCRDLIQKLIDENEDRPAKLAVCHDCDNRLDIRFK
jgi:uncharacterized protein YlaI